MSWSSTVPDTSRNPPAACGMQPGEGSRRALGFLPGETVAFSRHRIKYTYRLTQMALDANRESRKTSTARRGEGHS